MKVTSMRAIASTPTRGDADQIMGRRSHWWLAQLQQANQTRLWHRQAVTILTRLGWLMGLFPLALAGCFAGNQVVPPLEVKLHQQWQLQPGDRIGNYPVLGGLGDISIGLNRQSVYAPFRGRAQPSQAACVLFSSPDVPAYLFRFCGLENPRLGSVSAGDRLGRAQTLQFATLRKQPNGTWAIVEPSRQILERILQPARP